MSVRLSARLAAAGISAALVAGGVTLAAGGPADAATSSPAPVQYLCDGSLLGLPTFSDVPLQLSAIVPADAGSGISSLPIIGSLDLGSQGLSLAPVVGVLTVLASAGDTLLLDQTPLPKEIRLTPAAGALDSLVGGDGLPLTGDLADLLPADAAGGDLSLPQTLDLTGPLSSLTCALADGASGLLGTLPGTPTTGGTGNTGGTKTSTKPVVKKKPAKHASTVQAKPVKRRVKHAAHPRVRVVVRTMGHGARGKVFAHVGKRQMGSGWLKNGRLTLVLKKLARGEHNVRIDYRGNSAVRAGKHWVSFRIIK